MHELFWWHYSVSCALISEHFCKTFTGIKESSIQNLHSFFPPYLKLSRYERINVCSHCTCKSIDFRGLFCWRKMCKQNLLYWKRVKRWNRGTERCHDHRAISWFPFFFPVAVKCIRFSQEPADQSVVLGERVVLSCVVFNYSGIVQWTKDGLALGIGEGLRGEWKTK